VQLQLTTTSSERAALQADVSMLRHRLSELAEVQQQFIELQKHDASVSARVSVLEEEHVVSTVDVVGGGCVQVTLVSSPVHGRQFRFLPRAPHQDWGIIRVASRSQEPCICTLYHVLPASRQSSIVPVHKDGVSLPALAVPRASRVVDKPTTSQLAGNTSATYPIEVAFVWCGLKG
jgi:hypothetical protein